VEIDAQVQKVIFSYVDNNGTSEIHVTTPHFWDYADIDPNFAVLLEASAGPGPNHGGSGLPAGSIIAIVISIVGAAMIVAMVIIFLVRRKDRGPRTSWIAEVGKKGKGQPTTPHPMGASMTAYQGEDAEPGQIGLQQLPKRDVNPKLMISQDSLLSIVKKYESSLGDLTQSIEISVPIGTPRFVAPPEASPTNDGPPLELDMTYSSSDLSERSNRSNNPNFYNSSSSISLHSRQGNEQESNPNLFNSSSSISLHSRQGNEENETSSETPTRDKVYKCEICSKQFRSVEFVRAHLLLKHPGKGTWGRQNAKPT